MQFRGPEARRAEVRIESAPKASGRIVVDWCRRVADVRAPAEPGRRERPAHSSDRSTVQETVTELDPWDPHAAILAVLVEAIAGRELDIHPNLLDGTRAMELSEATVRSLKRGSTVDLHYEEISEAGTFKGVMTSLGCVVVPVHSRRSPPGTRSVPRSAFRRRSISPTPIPPVSILFILLQLLRFVVRSPGGKE